MLREIIDLNGFDVPVETRGSSGQTLVFLPGFGCHPAYYRSGLSRIARDTRVLAPDLSFRTHRRLPETIEGYADVVHALARHVPRDAIWAGHSFGALLALMGDRPVIACAPSVPIRMSVGRMVLRAVRLQLRELAGFDGPRGVPFAARVQTEYVRTAALRPGALFPALQDQLSGARTGLEPQAPAARIFLAHADRLYTRREARTYLGAAERPDYEVSVLEAGHDWPITHPRDFARRVREAMSELLASVSGPDRAESAAG